ncbi:protein RCC2 homolog [Folsomia candida]|uniref:protein RCC2 homolog n=1 Tax=Folsomia candida TaxID=158441 RepID=UPI00160514A8|nr:protein RCC2 homolog [Folsomia candida]
MFGLTICFWRMVFMNGLFYMCILSPDVSPVRHATCIFFANGAALLNLFNVYNFTKRVEILDMLQLFIDYGEDEGSSICAKDTLADLVMKLGCYSSIILPLCLTILGATMSCEAPFVGAVLIDCSVQDGTHLLSKSILTLFDLWMNMFELTNAFWSVFIVLFPGIRFILDSLGYLVACDSAIISEDGKLYTWGRNDCGQLGHGDTKTKHKPTLVKHLSDYTIVNVAMGRGHTLFLTDYGAVYSCGSDKMGQLGQGTKGKDKLTPSKIDYTGKPIVRMACGADFSMIVDIGGGIWSFGSPEYGQLGHGTDGKLLEKANKISFVCEKSPRQITKFVEKNKQVATPITNVSIADVKCGTNHTIVLDDKSHVFTFGFAGYGRLGHAETKDEMVPRQVKQLENFRCVISKIAAGSTFCLAAATTKNLYFWGQTKSSGEATMYPKPVLDLSGWNINNIACANKSIMVVADDTVIAWGPSPTYGELCYGDGQNKSSTVPKEAKPLEGIQILDIACGFGHSLLIAKDLTPEDRERIAKLPRLP